MTGGDDEPDRASQCKHELVASARLIVTLSTRANNRLTT